MNDSELINEIEAQRDLMIEVATGKRTIQDVNDEYKKRRFRIQKALEKRGLKDPNNFWDLWKWYGKWKNDLPNYQSRREFILDLYEPLIAKVHTLETQVKAPQNFFKTLEEIENFQLKYQTYISDSEYEELVDSILSAKINVLCTYIKSLNLEQAELVLENLELEPGQAVSILKYVNSYVIPELKRKMTGEKLHPVAQQVVFDLRSHLKNIKTSDTITFLEEAISCFEQGLFRSSVIMSWVGAVSLLHEYVANNCLTQFNSEAIRRSSKWKEAINKEDLSKMKESEFLDVIESLSIIDKNVKQHLKICLQLRNSCGHLNSLQFGQNTVASHIEILISNVFAKF